MGHPLPLGPQGPEESLASGKRRRPLFQHLLVPTDGSAMSETAIERAVVFAKDSGAEITFFHAQESFYARTDVALFGEGFAINPDLGESFAKAMLGNSNRVVSDRAMAFNADPNNGWEGLKAVQSGLSPISYAQVVTIDLYSSTRALRGVGKGDRLVSIIHGQECNAALLVKHVGECAL